MRQFGCPYASVLKVSQSTDGVDPVAKNPIMRPMLTIPIAVVVPRQHAKLGTVLLACVIQDIY